MSSIGKLESLGYSVNQRHLLFLLVCIPLRLSFPAVAFKFRESTKVNFLLMVAGIISILVNFRNLRGNPWWNRKNNLMSSALLVLAVIASMYKEEYNKAPAIILLIDVLFGVGSYLAIRPFQSK